MTQGNRKQTTEPILGTPFLGTAILGINQLQPVEWEGVAYCSIVGIPGNIPRFVYHAGHTRKASLISKTALDKCGKGVGNFYLS